MSLRSIFNKDISSKKLNNSLPLTFDEGWSPTFALESSGGYYYLKIADWVRVSDDTNPSTKPTAYIGKYVGSNGLVDSIANAAAISVLQGINIDEAAADHTTTTPTGSGYAVYNTTDGHVYIWDGASWNDAGLLNPDVSSKANLIAVPTTNGIVIQTAGGDLADSGVLINTSSLSALDTNIPTDLTVKEFVESGTATLTNKTIDADNNTISNIELGAECTGASTDLTDTADITYNTDTNVSSNSWVLDEDNMISDDATKVPTQQSVKAYVDSQTTNRNNYYSETVTTSTPQIGGIRSIDLSTVSTFVYDVIDINYSNAITLNVHLPSGAAMNDDRTVIVRCDTSLSSCFINFLDGLSGTELFPPVAPPELDVRDYNLFILKCTGSTWVVLDTNIASKAQLASTSVYGITSMATDAECDTGTSSTLAVSPSNLDDRTGGLKCITFEIGEWDMYITGGSTTYLKAVGYPAAVGDGSKVRAAQVIIRDDSGGSYNNLGELTYSAPNFTGTAGGSVLETYSGTGAIKLGVATGGTFDNASYDSTGGYNRGWITVWYEA